MTDKVRKGTVSINVDTSPPGTEFFVPGLGLVVNGKIHDVDAVQITNYEVATGIPFPASGHLELPSTTPVEEMLDREDVVTSFDFTNDGVTDNATVVSDVTSPEGGE